LTAVKAAVKANTGCCAFSVIEGRSFYINPLTLSTPACELLFFLFAQRRQGHQVLLVIPLITMEHLISVLATSISMLIGELPFVFLLA
jgi:hypothetical protein